MRNLPAPNGHIDMKYLRTLILVVTVAAGIATGFAIGRATSPNQKAVEAAEARAEKCATEAATMTKQATYWEATAKTRAEEITRVTAELTLCNARPTTNTGKIKNNVRLK